MKNPIIPSLRPALLFLALAASAEGAISMALSFGNYLPSSAMDGVTVAAGEWYDGKTGLIYEDISTGSGYSLGLIVEATSTFTTPGNSGSGNTDDVKINMNRDSDVDFTVSMYNQLTGNLVDTTLFGGDFSYSLSFYDIDGTRAGGLEQITSYDHTGYRTFSGTTLNVTTSSGAVTAKAGGTVNDVANPSPGNFPNEAKEVTIVFDFENTAQSTFSGAIDGGLSSSQRNIFMDGNNFTVVPEPSSALLLSLGGVVLLRRNRS